MSYFKAKMHQIRFRLGLRPRRSDPAGGAHSASPDPLTGFEGVLLLREGKGMGEKGREGGEKEERGKELEKKGEGEGGGRKGRGMVASWLGGWTPLASIGATSGNVGIGVADCDPQNIWNPRKNCGS